MIFHFAPDSFNILWKKNFDFTKDIFLYFTIFAPLSIVKSCKMYKNNKNGNKHRVGGDKSSILHAVKLQAISSILKEYRKDILVTQKRRETWVRNSVLFEF